MRKVKPLLRASLGLQGKVIFTFFFLLLVSHQAASQTVSIPRDGFPYCEPFTRSQTRANTVFDGTPNKAFLTAASGADAEGDGFLQLTDNSTDQRGYVFIDLPFSSAYGIKVSFEYFAYGGLNPPAYADGISFFMFDGDIGPSTFQIGGLGGSLGYAPWRRNANSSPIPDQPGLKGGYIGIGFDAFRNWGNEYEGRFGGFKSAVSGFGPVPDEKQYYNSIAIRGPESSNYKFIDGKRTYSRSFLNEEQPAVYTDPINSIYYLFDGLDPLDYLARRFKIGSVNKAEECSQDGYRKVFIDLAPTGGGNFLLTVDMLVNNGGTLRLENIFNKVPYNFPAPKNLKIGFAASTGTPNTNFHQIRNVTAEVSDYLSIPIPEIENLSAEVCEGDANLFEFDVDLKSENSFVRCVQLFESDPGVPDNSAPTGGNPSLTNCGLSNVCIERCNPANNSKYLPGKGTFTVELEQLTTGNFDDERFAASVRFVPDPGFVGTAQVYYQVLDNYGLLSFAKTITVTSNPDPIKIQDPTISNPSCSGQNDGQISGLIIGDLVNGFDYEWIYNGISQGKSNASVTSLTSDGKATFSLSNINIGTYILKVWNPSDKGRCEIPVSISITQEKGTPVEVEVNDKVICEGQVVDFNPVIDPAFGNDSGAKFFWYTSSNRAGGPIINGSTRVIDGRTVTFKITNDRLIEITGLTSNGTSPKIYQFFVEAQSNSNPSGNFCPYIGDVLGVAKVTVYPPITFTATKVSDDWCLDGGGRINASVSNPTSSITYTLVNSSGNIVATNSTGQFLGLSKGNYEVFATSSNPVCSSVKLPILIDGPTAPLTLTSGPMVNAFCNGPNGSLQFTLTGGNPVYSITLNGNPLTGATVTGSNYTVTNLAAGSYTVSVTDSRGCVKNTTIVINGDPLSQYGTVSDEICEGETAQVSPTIINQSSSTPSYKWYYRDGTGAYVQINNGNTINGISFVIDASNNLLVTGLAPQATPYTYYLEVTGSKVCAQGYIPAQILVNPKPIISEPVITQVTCNGLLDGSIRAQLGVGNLADFEFNLIGNNGFNSGYLKNSGIFTGLAAGTYELFVKSEKGCISSKSNLVVTEPSSLVINQVAKVDATCDEDNGSFQFTVSGGTQLAAGGYTLEINGAPISSLGTSITSNSPTDFTISKLAPGSYILKATDKNNCIVTLTFTIADTPIPEFDVQDDLICEGESSVLIPEIVSNSIGAVPVFAWSYEDPAKPGTFITINSGDKVGNLTYTISNGQLTVAGLTAQTAPYVYYLSVSGNLVCPASPIPAEIKVVKNPEATFEIENVSCFGGSDGAIKLLTSNPTTDLTYTLSGTGQTNSTGIFLGLKAGSYTVTVKNLSGCEISVPLEVTEPTAPIQINKPDLLRSSCDLENGSIENLVISGGWGDYIVTWKKGSLTGTTIPGTATEVKNLGPGTYFLIIKDKEECEVSFSFVIEESSDPEYAVVPPINVCLGQPVSIRPVHLAPNPSLPPAAPTEVQWYTGPGKTGLISNGADASTPSISYTIDDTDWLNPELKITGLPAGVHDFYFYVVCTGKESKIEVTVYDVPKVELELTPITCFGNTNGKVKISSGALPVYTYSVNGGSPLSQAAFEALNFGAGIYDLEVSTPAGCAQKTTFEILGPSAALSSSPMSKVDPGCNAPNGKLEFTLSGGWLPYTLDVIKNGTSLGTQTTSNSVIVLDGFTSGVYQVKVTDARGCTITTNTVTLVDGPSQIAVDDVEICVGGTAVLTPVIDPLAPGAIFSWFLDAGLTQKINSSATPAADGRIYVIDSSTGALSVTNLPARVSPYVYYVTATGPGVCPGFVERVEVKVYDQPTVIPTLNVCTGDPVVIKGIYPMSNPSYPSETISEVQWYTGPGKAGLISNGSDPSLPSVTYTIEDTDWLNPELKITGLPAGVHDFYFYVVCTGKESKIEVTVYDVPKVELELTPITCFGNTNGKVKISSGALPVYTYSVNGGSPLSQAAFEALNLGAGVYNLEVNTPAGCTQKTTFEILGPGAALSSTPMSKVDPGCNAPNGKLEFTLSGGWLPYTLDVIKNGTSLGTQTTSNGAVVLNGYSSGVYQVKVTDARGCSITTNTVTLVDGPTQIAVENVEICIGGTAILTPTLDPTAPGALFDWYLDAGLTQKITSSATPAADGRIYLINTSTGALSIANLPSRVAPYVYFVTASGSGVCPGFVERVEVKVFDQPTLTSQVKNEVCFGDGGEITVLASGGSGNFTYSLNGGAFVNSNVFKVPVGNYQVEVRTKEGCSVLLNGVVVSGPSASLVANNLQQDSPTCGQSNGIVRFQISGGYSPYEVKWVKNGTSTGVQNVPNAGEVQITNLGIGNYSFEVRDNAGCLVTLPGNFTLVEVPTEISITDDVICEGEVAELIPTLPQNIINPTYTWSFDAGGTNLINNGMTVDGATFNLTPTGELSITGLKGATNPYKYYVTASGNGICNISPKEVKVKVYSIPSLRVSNPSVVCDPKGTVDLTDYIEGFNPSLYDYNVLSPSGVSMQINELATVSLSGDYRVSSAIKGSGCWNQPLRIRVLIANELLAAEFNYEVDLGNGTLLPNAEVQIQENVQFYDFSQGKAIIWNWDFGDGNTSTSQNPSHQYLEKGTYTASLQVIDSIGCISTYERVIVVTDDYRIMVPNAFTPDGSKNQNFKPYTRGIASMEFYVFNTWGELLYKTESLEDQGWNGFHNGKPAPNGNYVYRGKFTSRSGEVTERSGVFLLIR